LFCRLTLWQRDEVEGSDVLLHLPLEVWVEGVLTKLPHRDILSFSMTGRLWRSLALWCALLRTILISLLVEFSSLYFTDDLLIVSNTVWKAVLERKAWSRDILIRDPVPQEATEAKPTASIDSIPPTESRHCFSLWRRSQLPCTLRMVQRKRKVPDTHWRRTSVSFDSSPECLAVYERDAECRPDLVVLGHQARTKGAMIACWYRGWATQDQVLHYSKYDHFLIEQNNEKPHSGRKRVWIKLASYTGHSDTVKCLVVANNKQTVISGSEDCTIRFWKLPDADNLVLQPATREFKHEMSPDHCTAMLRGHLQPVACMAVNEESKLLVLMH
jgi:hypothetical protein